MVFVTLVCLIGILKIISDKFANSKKTYCILMSICLIFVAGFRSYMVGTDTRGYVESFFYSPLLNFKTVKEMLENREFLFYIYQAFIRNFTSNYTLYLLPIAIFYTISISKFIYKYSTSSAISYILFMSMAYFTFSMAGLRQTVAMGILMFALDKLLDNDYIKCILLILLASCFHISALSFIAVFAVYILPLNAWYLGITAALSVIFYFKGNGYTKIIVDYIWGDKRAYGDIEYGGISILILLIIIAVGTLMFYPEVLKYYKLKKNTEIENKDIVGKEKMVVQNLRYNAFFTKMVLFSIPIQVLAIFQANAFRVAMMFHVCLIALLPNVINHQKDYIIRFAGKCVVIVCLLIQLFVFTYWSGDINPFTFFWQI